MTLLLYCVAAMVLGPLALWFGVSWIRQGGTFTDAEGVTQSNAVAGCGLVMFGVIACVTAVLMARDVEPKLWLLAIALVGPVIGMRALWRGIAVESIEGVLGSVRQLLSDGHAPEVISLRGNSAAHGVLRAALRVTRPPDQTETPDYRRATRQPGADYLEQVTKAAAAAQTRALRSLGKGLLPCSLPLFAIAFYATAGAPLEALGWQVLAASSGASVLCAAAGLFVRAQARRASDGIRGLLATPQRARSSPAEPHQLA